MKIKILEKKLAWEGKFKKVWLEEFINQKGEKGVWETVEIKAKKGVFIFPLTKYREVILEKIYRIPIRDYILTLPAGVCELNEDEEEAAERELLEETGYKAEGLIKIFETPIDPSLRKDSLALFLAKNVTQKIPLDQRPLDEAEDIEVLKLPLEELPSFLINSENKIDIKVLGFYLLLKEKGFI